MRIAVYCSARKNLPDEVVADARKLGLAIGEGGNTLVYGGLEMGLMDVVASATAEAGGRVMGVVPSNRMQLQHPANTVNIPVSSLHERKQIMEENADLFVALDGGCGTLDEIMSALASMTFFNEPKPILVLDRNGLYSPLRQLFDEMVGRKLMAAEVASRITFHPTADSLIAHIKSLQS